MKRSITMVCLVMLAALCVPPPSFAQTAQVGKITYAEGRVDLLKPGADKAELATEYLPVSVGDFVRTKSGSKAEIVFGDNTVVRLAENSRIEIKDYKLDADSRRLSALIKLDRGKARATVAKMPTFADFVIETPNAEAKTGESDLVTFYQAGSSGVLVQQGSLSVLNPAHPEKSVMMPAGSSVLVPLEDAPTEPRPFMPVEMKFHEKDTTVPESVAKRGDLTVLRGSITRLSGDVTVTLKGTKKAHQATLDEVIGEGDRIETGADGSVAVMFGNGNAIFLKPDSTIRVTRLIFDPKTSEYENLFEADKGKIKALIEKIGGKSKFEIKTPTAVCGARGTIMYLAVSPQSTGVFFEGGHGYMNSTISSDSVSVGAGERSASDGSGSVSDPEPVSEGERMENDESWGSEGGAGDGYSSAEGEGGSFLGGSGEGAGSGEDGSFSEDAGMGDGQGGAGDGTMVTVPITETLTTVTETSTTTLNQVLKIGTLFTSTITGGRGEASLESGGGIYDLTFDVDFPTLWSGTFTPSAIGGSYEAGGAGTCHIWTADGVHSRCPVTGLYVTPDGGAFFGIVGAANSSTNMAALFAALYIDPSGNAGVFRGTFSGPDAALFSLSSYDLTVDAYASEFSVLPENLHGSVIPAGNFYAEGVSDDISIYAFVQDGTALTIDVGAETHLDWGLWAARIAGSHDSPLPYDWAVPVAGLTYSAQGIDGAMLAEITATGAIDGLFGGSFGGMVLTVRADGSGASISGTSIVGDLVGSYVDAGEGELGTWQAVGAGEWVEVDELVVNGMTSIADVDALIQSTPANGFGVTDSLSGLEVRNMVTPEPGMLGVNGSIQVNTMDMNFYAVAGSAAVNGIWASIIQGTFTPPSLPSDSWSAVVSNQAGAEAYVTGTQWSGGTWSAVVSGTAPNGANTVSFDGVAAGTYSDAGGTFVGAGTGTWKSDSGSLEVAG